MIKILLLSPPVFDFYFTPARKEPLGLLYIKMALEKIKNVSVDIYDTTISGKTRKVKLPESFNYLKEIYAKDHSCFSLFSNYYRFGDSFNKIIDRIIKGKYDIAGISALFSAYFPDVENLIRLIKEKTRAKVVAGGWAVNAEKERLFAESKADFFLSGNGEDTFPQFVNALINNTPLEEVKGVIFRKNGTIHSTPQLIQSKIPEDFPLRTNKYFFNNKRIAKVVLSRGCLYKCDFCPIHTGNTFSLRTIQSIERELKYLSGAGIEIVDFEDDNLFCTKEFSRELIPLLEKYHNKGLSYVAMNGITARNIVTFIDRIIKAGFIELNLSLVTSDDKLSHSVNRPFSLEVIKEVINHVQGRIKTLVFIIIGLPGSTPKKVLNDILALAQLPVTIGVSPLYMVPGVPMFEKMGLPSDRRLLRGSALYKFDNSFTREDVASLWKFVRMVNWLKSSRNNLSNDEKENLFYFSKSITEKTWYRKTRNNIWEKGFSFTIDLPDNFFLCKLNGEIFNFNIEKYKNC